jgi:large subunit ribosomal protein L30
MAQIKVVLTKSPIGHKPNQIKTLKALGLTKVSSSVVKEDTEAMRGMLRTVAHLIAVESVK